MGVSQISRKLDVEYSGGLVEFLEQHNQKILNFTMAHEDARDEEEIQRP